MTPKKALEDTLLDVALSRARSKVDALKESVASYRYEIQRIDRFAHQDNYILVWRTDHRKAKRELTKCEKDLKLWSERLKALKQL